MKRSRDCTPEEAWEWLLEGLVPEAAIQTVEHDISQLENKVRQLQVELSNAHSALKKIRADEWPKDKDGFLTLSPDNPTR